MIQDTELNSRRTQDTEGEAVVGGSTSIPDRKLFWVFKKIYSHAIWTGLGKSFVKRCSSDSKIETQKSNMLGFLPQSVGVARVENALLLRPLLFHMTLDDKWQYYNCSFAR